MNHLVVVLGLGLGLGLAGELARNRLVIRLSIDKV